MRRNLVVVCLLVVLLAAACSAVQPEVVPTPTAVVPPSGGTLYVNPEDLTHEISEYVLGSNHGPWIAVPADMIQEANDSKVTILRFPGGEWGDRNDIKDYHITAFMMLCEQMGADVNFTVRVLDSTPEDAAEMVELVNREMEYGVKYWTIGNEPTLYEGSTGETWEPDP